MTYRQDPLIILRSTYMKYNGVNSILKTCEATRQRVIIYFFYCVTMAEIMFYRWDIVYYSWEEYEVYYFHPRGGGGEWWDVMRIWKDGLSLGFNTIERVKEKVRLKARGKKRQRYTWDYEKLFYDVKDKKWKVFEHCRPNAWKFWHVKTWDEVLDVVEYRIGDQLPIK